MSKCEDCEEITSLLIGMRNYYLLADFWTRTSPKYTNLELAIPRIEISLEIHAPNELGG